MVKTNQIEVKESGKSQQHEDDVPEPMKKVFSMMMQAGPLPPQILDKITPGHIEKVLDISSKSNEREAQDNKSIRRYMFSSLIIGVLAFVFLVIYLKSDSDLLISLVGILLSFVGGFGAGYGYCKRKIN